MLVLGINDGHDAGVCLLRDGRVVLHSSEERRRNVKNFPGIPVESLRGVFQRTGIDPKEVDLVALSSLLRTTVPSYGEKPVYSVLRLLYFLGQWQWSTNLGRRLLQRLRKRRELLAALADLGLADKPVQAFDHHLCHAACAYFHRPWEEDALVLTLDGAGDGVCATVNVGSGDQLRLIASTPKFHSPAAGMYSAITAHLGLKPNEHEYKVMGMAPYGRAEYCREALRPFFSVEGLRFRNHTGRIGERLLKRYRQALIGARFDNLSAACQERFEELVLQWAQNAMQATGIRKIACAGGAFLNVKANQLIRELPETEAFYAYPASDDGGTPIGAATLGYFALCSKRGVEPNWRPRRDMYLGFAFAEAEIEAAIAASKLPATRLPAADVEVARLVAAGHIVGRFAGAEEVGPRALGNRSILADPRDLRVIRKLNFAIKQRDFWMPFATSMLHDDARKYLKRLSDWPFYMIETFDTEPGAADAFIAGMHPFDMTVRPQVVTADLNPGYHALISAYKEMTGIGAVLNTSFNLHGFPIVGTPQVAIDTLLGSAMDYLALGPWLLENPARNLEKMMKAEG